MSGSFPVFFRLAATGVAYFFVYVRLKKPRSKEGGFFFAGTSGFFSDVGGKLRFPGGAVMMVPPAEALISIATLSKN